MRFDRVRREYKKTLWGEELDNENYAVPNSQTFCLGFLHQFDGKKYECHVCKNEFEENKILFFKNSRICITCIENANN